MSKGKNKKRKGDAAAAATSWEAVGATLIATLGNTIGQLIADGAEYVMAQRTAATGSSNGATTPPPVPPSPQTSNDLAVEILRQLERDGERTIADLAAVGGAGLTSTLQTLRAAREFGLIEFDETSGIVKLTDAGRRTVASLCGTREASVERADEEADEAENAEAYPE